MSNKYELKFCVNIMIGAQYSMRGISKLDSLSVEGQKKSNFFIKTQALIE